MAQTTPSPLPRVSDEEAKLYYAGLPSRPVLIARTGSTPWKAPTGLEAYPERKELRVVGEHEINKAWEDDLALKVHAILDAKEVAWTSTDVVRIAHFDEPSGGVILWIGVMPKSLPYEVGIDAALQCKGLLLEYGIKDVDVEIRESEVFPSAGPRLLKPTFTTDPTVDVREPLTATLGIPICFQSTPWAEGTGGLFISEGGDGKRLLLVTARHVVFPPNNGNNLFERTSDSQRLHDVIVLSDASFKQHLVSIKANIDTQGVVIKIQKRRIEKVAGRDDKAAKKEREDAQRLLDGAAERVMDLNAFHYELSTNWSTEHSRVLGHVIFSPPIVVGAGTEQYTQDVAVIEIDASKIDPGSFQGNVIDLGTKYPGEVLTAMMYPNPRNTHNFEYPGDRLLSLRGTITDEEMRRPTSYDQNNDPCIMVLKRGRTSGLTEWAILPFDNKSCAFSAKGDSGSAVVDGAGRIGGLLTSGGGATDSFDVTYATPISFVLKVIRSNKLFAEAYPTSGPSS
ncbi:hypothetical protein BC834DRAFT_968701 [Gloeopeniophorella convolvens]|nr:hypothetical protein BC834DRAFT_968701 [Gloeopeniophorella convolvens]